MKRSIVPAQITTVEDKVLGNLTPVQAGLISLPLLFGCMFFIGLPPHFHLVLYKVVLMIGLEVLGLILSIRIDGQLFLFWLAMRLRYNVRPQYYVYDKNDNYLRNIPEDSKQTDTVKTAAKLTMNKQVEVPKVELGDAVRIEELMADERANLRFKTGKNGRLYAITNEVKQ